MGIQERLAELAIILPQPPNPVANFTNFTKHDGLLFISGQGPVEADGTRYVGQVGGELTLEQGKAMARLVAINIVAVLNVALKGDWDRLDHFMKINGYVNSCDGFYRQPEVIDGCSDLLVKIFDDRGRHARTAIGVSVLPFNIPVEIEAIVALRS
jgi:enamine deaminase RidA (YjgF/YER057c/UK114 family)